MDFKTVIEGRDPAMQPERLAELIKGRQVEFTRELILQEPADIYSACCLGMYLLIANGMHIRRCKNCGHYSCRSTAATSSTAIACSQTGRCAASSTMSPR